MSTSSSASGSSSPSGSSSSDSGYSSRSDLDSNSEATSPADEGIDLKELQEVFRGQGTLVDAVPIQEFVQHVWGVPPAVIAALIKSSKECSICHSAISKYARAAEVGHSEFKSRNMASLFSSIVRFICTHLASHLESTDQAACDRIRIQSGLATPEAMWTTREEGEWETARTAFRFKWSAGCSHKSSATGTDARTPAERRVVAPTGTTPSPGSKSGNLEVTDSGLSDTTASATPPAQSCKDRKRKRDPESTVAVTRKRFCKPTLTPEQLELALDASQSMLQNSRYYTTGVSIVGCNVTLMYYDRMGAMRSEDFNLRTHPELLVLVIYSLHQTSPVEAGFNPYLHRAIDTVDTANHPTFVAVFPRQLDQGSRFHFPHNSKSSEMVYVIESILDQCPIMVGRGTLVCSVSHVRAGEEVDTAPGPLVVKLAWATRSREDERSLVKHLIETIPDFQDHLPNLHFSAAYHPKHDLDLPRFRIPCSQEGLEKLELRSLIVLVMTRYKKLWMVGTVDNFLVAFLDCVKCHHHAYKRGRILHRDLSQNNLMAHTNVDGSVRGVLSDWDLATRLGTQSTAEELRDMTGTWPFLAVDLLVPNCPTHLYRHDLESFFYVLVWAALHFDLKKGINTSDTHVAPEFSLWMNDDMEKARFGKRRLFRNPQLFDRLFWCHSRPEFQELWETWIEPFYSMFHAGFKAAEKEGMSESDNATLGGYVTFEKFVEAVGRKPCKVGA